MNKTVYMLYFKPDKKYLDIDGEELDDDELFERDISSYSADTPEEFLSYLEDIMDDGDGFTDYEIHTVNIILNCNAEKFDIKVSLEPKIK